MATLSQRFRSPATDWASDNCRSIPISDDGYSLVVKRTDKYIRVVQCFKGDPSSLSWTFPRADWENAHLYGRRNMVAEETFWSPRKAWGAICLLAAQIDIALAEF